MLQRLKIDKFKRIEGFDEELAPLTVLVGTNNSGKSSVLHAIHSSVALAQSRLRLFAAIPMGGNEVVFTISAQDILYLPLIDINWLAPGGGLTQGNGPTISFLFDDEAHSDGTVSIKRGKNRNLRISLKGRQVIGRIEKIAEPFSVYVPGLAGIAKAESFTAYGSLLRIIARGDANMVLRNVLYTLCENHKPEWSDFLGAVERVFPGWSLYVRFDAESDETIEVTVKVDDIEMPLDCVGTGFLQTIQILSYIFLFKPQLTLLDEPDSHLHPNNQRALGDLLWELAQEGRTQFILATHSRHLLDVFKEREGTKLMWMRKGKVEPYTTGIDVLADLGAFDNAEGLLSKGIEFVVLTEDKNKGLAKLIFEANGAPKDKYQVWAYKGCSNLDKAEALGKFIQEVSPNTKIIVHRDGDYLSTDDELFWTKEFARYSISVFFTPTVDLEGLCCRLEHLKELNKEFEDAVTAAFTKALEEMRPSFRKSAKNGRKTVDDIRHKKGEPTEGEVAIAAWADDLDFENERWRHGKDFIAAIRRLFKEATGQNLKAESPTKHLVIPSLKVWIAATKRPKAQGATAHV